MSWGKKLTRNAPSKTPSKNTTYKMFEELVGSQLIRELKIREGKNEAETALNKLRDALEATLSERLELPGSNPCNNAESRNVDQEERETNNQNI
jgi:hypothetical protein